MLTPWNKIYCTRSISPNHFSSPALSADFLWLDPPPCPPQPAEKPLPPPVSTPPVPISPVLALPIPAPPAPPPTSAPSEAHVKQLPVLRIKKRPRQPRGLLAYKKWWFRRQVGICVRGKLLCGMPVYLCENTLRVINQAHSYFIPLANVDYIQTADGLDAAYEHFSAPNGRCSV